MDNKLEVSEFQAVCEPDNPNNVVGFTFGVRGSMHPSDALRLYDDFCQVVWSFEHAPENSLDLAKFISES